MAVQTVTEHSPLIFLSGPSDGESLPRCPSIWTLSANTVLITTSPCRIHDVPLWLVRGLMDPKEDPPPHSCGGPPRSNDIPKKHQTKTYQKDTDFGGYVRLWGSRSSQPEISQKILGLVARGGSPSRVRAPKPPYWGAWGCFRPRVGPSTQGKPRS